MTTKPDHDTSSGMSTQAGDAMAAASARVGEARVHKAQNYICTAVSPYTRRDGSEGVLLI